MPLVYSHFLEKIYVINVNNLNSSRVSLAGSRQSLTGSRQSLTGSRNHLASPQVEKVVEPDSTAVKMESASNIPVSQIPKRASFVEVRNIQNFSSTLICYIT